MSKGYIKSHLTRLTLISICRRDWVWLREAKVRHNLVRKFYDDQLEKYPFMNRNESLVLPVSLQYTACTQGRERARSTYYPGVPTIQECVLSRSVYYPGVCTIQECVLSRSVYYPGVCTIEEYVLSGNVYYPGVRTFQEYVLSRSTYYPGVCTIQECVLSRSMYYPGMCTIQEYILSRSMYYPGVCTSTHRQTSVFDQRQVQNMYVCYSINTDIYSLTV